MSDERTLGTGRIPQRGFTLIEVLIAVAIVGIVAAIAVPSYSRFVTKGRRADATAFLLEVAGEQTRFFTERNAYAAKMSDLGYGTGDSFATPEGYYTVSIARPSARSYTLTATPVAGGPQAADGECGSFTLSSTGARGTSAGGGDCW